MKKYFTIKEAAELLSVTPLTLRNWDKAGKLLASRNPINNYRVYRKEDIEELLGKIEFGQNNEAPPRRTASKKLNVRFDE
ncbi:MAG: MerR family DNA-binding transcriptional regulator [Parcubacteria group bacterium]|nr:MerR family DNA-binding transcriptional regulator [Parcubacteria group bacterium]